MVSDPGLIFRLNTSQIGMQQSYKALFHSYHLELDPMTLVLKRDLDIMIACLHVKNQSL